MASKKGHADIVRLLLERDADPNIQGESGRTALIGASESGHVDTVRVLLERGADPNIQDDEGSFVCSLDSNPTTKSLIENQIRCNRKKAFMLVLTVNGYIQSPPEKSTMARPLLRFERVLGDEGLVRVIMGYM